MRSCAVAIVVVLVWNVSANSLTPSSRASSRIIGNMKKELDSLQILIRKIAKGKCDAVNAKPYGTVYTRWGHDNCPRSGTRLVYSGYVGGAHYTYKGGAADYLCLTRHPIQSTDRRKYSTGLGYLFGSEYEFGRDNSKNEHDVPCAVCQSEVRGNSLMLPGRNVCPKGWHREYKGLIMSGYQNHPAASQHVCVDNAQKTIPGSHKDKNGKLLYPVRTQCGSLKCPPYKNHHLVTCAVCTR